MELEVKYQGKRINTDDLKFIKQVITNNANMSRRQKSKLICEVWNWRHANGHLKDMVCRDLLLQLELSYYIQLSPVKFRPNNLLANHCKPIKIDIDTMPIYDYDQIEIKKMRRMLDKNYMMVY